MDLEASRARRAARESQRRRARRRGIAILLGLALVVALALAVVLGAFGLGSGASRPSRRAAPAGGRGSRGHAAGPTASRGASTSAPVATGKPGHQPVPILMYHVINPPPAGAPFPGLYVSKQEFAAQMHALKAAGWHAVTLDQVQAYWTRGAPLPAKPIVLSFDNGYQSQYTNALPILHRLGWVGDENLQLTGLPPSQGGMSRSQVRGLVAAGWELDTQGYSHAELPDLSSSELNYQVVVARRTMQRRYHVSVNWFCYPSGHYDATVIAAVKRAGYMGSTTVVPGWAHPGEDRFALHRLRVLEGTSPSDLLDLVEGSREDGPTPSEYT